MNGQSRHPSGMATKPKSIPDNTPQSLVFIDDVQQAIGSVREEYDRAMKRAIRKCNIAEAASFLASWDATEEVERAIKWFCANSQH